MSTTNIFTPFSEEELIPKEEKLEVIKKGKQFSIGIPKETCLNERRTCITPDAVQVLVENGHEIIIESGAGQPNYVGCSRKPSGYFPSTTLEST